MKWKHFRFGIRDADLEFIRERLEQILGIKMKGVASDAYGGDLYSYRSQDITEFLLFQNWNAHEHEWNSPRFDEFDLLISFERHVESEPIEKKIGDDPILKAELVEKSKY
jgi:hypothetical protein